MYKCQYCSKEFESKAKLGGHVVHCKKNPNYNEDKEKKQLEFARNKNTNIGFIHKNEKAICQYCGKECFVYGLKNHEKHCKKNPNYVPGKSNFGYGRIPWNKGLTAKDDPRLAKQVEIYKKHYQEGKFKIWCEGLSKETDERISKLSKAVSSTLNNKVKEGTWHVSFSKARTYEYRGSTFHGTWELNFAKYLDSKNINWSRPDDIFEYFWQEEVHQYHPDFYLPEFDIFIEIKGYPTDRDFAKWEQFPKDKNLDIYFGDELHEAGIVDEYKNVYDEVKKYRVKKYNILGCSSVVEQ